MPRLRRAFKVPQVTWLYEPFRRFFRLQVAGSILLLLAVVVALAWANSPWGITYFALWESHISIVFELLPISEPLLVWINDGLMTIFFLLVGLEMKRAILVGELSRPKDAAFPIIAAIGGMAMPAALYTLFNFGAPTGVGWAIPMATDIAFSLSVLALLGEQIPIGLKVFLSTLAIADDLGSIAIIAVFFTTSIALLPLLVAGGILVLLVLVGRTAIRNPSIYMVLGVGVWLCFLLSGVHATIAGVLVAMTVPARPILDTGAFCSKGEQLLREFESATKPGCDILANKEQYAAAQAMESICERVMTPLQRLESYVQPWVIFGIIPLFALANAGVLLVLNPFVTFANMTFLGVVLGLVLGKPIGISLFAWLGVRLGLAAKPKGVTWRQISAASCLGGIGFTMSLFLANLALGSTPHLDVAKVAILAGSLIAGTLGFVLLGGSRMILGLLRKIRLRVSRILNRNSTVKQS